jgi:hypothetical protein
MHLRVIGLLVALPLLPVASFAQTGPQTAAAVENAAAPPPAAAGSSGPAGVTREQYMQRAQERAGQRAGTRFDRMDANHDGLLDRAEVRTWRSEHPRRARVQPDQAPPQ